MLWGRISESSRIHLPLSYLIFHTCWRQGADHDTMTLARRVLRVRDGGSFPDAGSSSGKSLLFHRAALPSECYDDCNNAYKIALSIGRVPSLCTSGSTFLSAYGICASCIMDNESNNLPLSDYISPEFAPFIDYCQGVDVTTSTSWVQVIPTFGGSVTPTIPCTECVPLTLTYGSGEVETVMVKPGLKDLTKTQSFSPTSSAEEPIPSSSSSNKTSKATIIGPVVACGIILILLGTLFFWRRYLPKRNASTPAGPQQEEVKYEKAQLHSDCVPRGPTYELQGSVPPSSSPTTSPAVAEMTANEVAAQEMPTIRESLT
ncbi:hypothetical protein AUP68_02308 [Ilyonectria robusta]